MPFTKETARQAGKQGRAKQLSQATERAREPAELKLMRHVVRKPASADTTEEQKNYRAWMKENRNGFMKRYTALLDEARGRSSGEPEQSEVWPSNPLLEELLRPRDEKPTPNGWGTRAEESKQEKRNRNAAPASNGHAESPSDDASDSASSNGPVHPEKPAGDAFELWYVEGCHGTQTDVFSIMGSTGLAKEEAERAVQRERPIVRVATKKSAEEWAGHLLALRSINTSIRPPQRRCEDDDYQRAVQPQLSWAVSGSRGG